MRIDVVRWRVVVEYRTDAGIADVEHYIDELSDLHDLIERGPNFYTIVSIAIFLLNPEIAPCLTVEEAAKL